MTELEAPAGAPEQTAALGAAPVEEESKEEAPKIQVSDQIDRINQIQANKKLCFTCRKKVGLLGFECKCSFVFCSKHRYAEDHACEFDFKKMQQEKISKDNQKIVAAKVSLF